MKQRNWWLLFTASIIFILTAPIEQGNGATLLGILLAGLLIHHRPTKENTMTIKDPTRFTKTPSYCAGCKEPHTFCTCWEEEHEDWERDQKIIDQQTAA